MAAFKLWLLTPLGRWASGLVGGGLAVLVAIVGIALLRAHWIGQGVAKERAAEAARLLAAKPAIAKVTAGGVAITTKTEERTRAETERIKIVYRDLIREVPTYVTPEADRRCDLPVGFVRMHDQAAAGGSAVSAPAGDVRDASSGIPLSAATGTIVGNYGVAYQWRKRAVACETWAVEQADIWKKNIRTAPVSP